VRRPKKRLLKADESKRVAFVREYVALRVVAQLTGAKIFFVDEAHFYADADLRGKRVLKRAPTLVDSSSPCYGEKASHYFTVCVETGDVEYLPLAGNSTPRPPPSSSRTCEHVTRRPSSSSGTTRPPTVVTRSALTSRRPPCACDWCSYRPTAPNSTPTSTSGAASARRSPPTPASAPPPRSGHTSTPSSLGWSAGLVTRTAEVTRRCRTTLQTKADALDAVGATTAHLHDVRHLAHPNADLTWALVSKAGQRCPLSHLGEYVPHPNPYCSLDHRASGKIR